MENKMNIMIKNINNSKNYNKERNIFYYSEEKFPLGLEIIKDIESGLSLKDQDIKFLCQKIVKSYKLTFMENNQYINFNDNLSNGIYQIYYEYFININGEDLTRKEIEKYTEDYQKKLILFFSNIDEIKVLDNNKEKIDKIPCSEYSAKHQMKILKLNIEDIKEPLIDIGCGENGNLVNYLRSLDIQAYGIDRNIDKDNEYLKECSWFQYEFEKEKYGTIIGHMSFTNHFKREHLKINGDYISYAKKYMEILESLKSNGKFYYTPNLEFIEDLLPEKEYKVENYNIESNYLANSNKNDHILGTIITKK